MKEYWKENKGFIITMSIIGLIVISLITVAVVGAVQHQNWIDSLTPEKLAQYEAEKEAERQANIYTYDVVSVSKYVKPVTNGFGGVIRTEICYEFNYMDGSSLKHMNDFQHLEYGLTKVTIGDSNKYIIDTNGEDIKYLQLTKETFENMQTLSSTE